MLGEEGDEDLGGTGIWETMIKIYSIKRSFKCKIKWKIHLLLKKKKTSQ